MNCDTCREAVSARLDGEAPAAPDADTDAHLAACAGCRRWAETAADLHRATRVRPAEWGPDLTVPILARIAAEDKPGQQGPGRLTDVRLALAVVAVLQLALAVPPLLGVEAGASIHVARELGSFDAALAVGFLVCALQPARAAGLLPVTATLALLMAGTALVDVVSGQAPTAAEAHHALDLVGLALVWLAARTAPRQARGRWRGAVAR
jgi:predicted anti-sigma-YlaC factor YlaD